jgi:hypothetical protein
MALPLVDRERLLGGNWKIRPSAGLYFQRGWCQVVDAPSANLTLVRGRDFAAMFSASASRSAWQKVQPGMYLLLHGGNERPSYCVTITSQPQPG